MFITALSVSFLTRLRCPKLQSLFVKWNFRQKCGKESTEFWHSIEKLTLSPAFQAESEYGSRLNVFEVVTHLIWKKQQQQGVRGRLLKGLQAVLRAYVTRSIRRGIYVGCAWLAVLKLSTLLPTKKEVSVSSFYGVLNRVYLPRFTLDMWRAKSTTWLLLFDAGRSAGSWTFYYVCYSYRACSVPAINIQRGIAENCGRGPSPPAGGCLCSPHVRESYSWILDSTLRIPDPVRKPWIPDSKRYKCDYTDSLSSIRNSKSQDSVIFHKQKFTRLRNPADYLTRGGGIPCMRQNTDRLSLKGSSPPEHHQATVHKHIDAISINCTRQWIA